MKAIEYAKKYNVPVVLTLGTKFVIADNPEWWQAFLKEHVSILAMNEEEAEALTGESDPLLASDKALDWVDWCSAPPGRSGCTWRASRKKRASVKPSTRCCRAQSPNLTSTSSAALCVIKTASTRCVSSHIAPYMGGPEDHEHQRRGRRRAAALLHDITANAYHKTNVPNSSKHTFDWLTYSSLAQVCKYANRVSYQVLNQHSPRLTRGCRNGKTASKRRTGTGKVKRQPVVAVLVCSLSLREGQVRASGSTKLTPLLPLQPAVSSALSASYSQSHAHPSPPDSRRAR